MLLRRDLAAMFLVTDGASGAQVDASSLDPGGTPVFEVMIESGSRLGFVKALFHLAGSSFSSEARADSDDFAPGTPSAADSLNSIAQSLSGEIRHPIVIIDDGFSVLGFSSHEGPVDAARVQTILQKRIGPSVLTELSHAGLMDVDNCVR